MRHVVTNAFLNAGTFVVVAAINLALVPLLIGNYGLADYGLLAVCRLLLPTGLVAMVDLALPVVLARAMAAHGAEAAHADMRRIFAAGLTLSLAIGTAVSLVFFAASGGLDPHGSLSSWLSIGEEQTIAFSALIAGLAFTFPILFAGSVCQGTLEGLQRFRTVRLAELVSVSLFGMLCVGLVWQRQPFTYVALGFVMLQALRSVALAAAVLINLRGSGDWLPTSASFVALFSQIRVLYASKVIGVLAGNAIQTATLSFLGTGALGAFDAVMRIPRLLKTGFGLLNTVILPAATERETLGKRGQVQALILRTSRIVAFVTVPAVFVLTAFAGQLMGLWLGPDFKSNGIYLGIALTSTLLGVLTGVAASASVARLGVVRIVNLVALAELIVLALMLVWLLPRYGLAGGFAAMATVAVVSYFTRVWIYLPAFDIAGAEWRSPLARTAGAAAVPAIIGAVAYDWLFPDQYWIVIPATAILYLASLAAIYLAWSPVERRDLHHIVRILRDVRIRVWRSRSPYTRPNEKAQSGR